jgi:hypothetical protein
MGMVARPRQHVVVDGRGGFAVPVVLLTVAGVLVLLGTVTVNKKTGSSWSRPASRSAQAPAASSPWS